MSRQHAGQQTRLDAVLCCSGLQVVCAPGRQPSHSLYLVCSRHVQDWGWVSAYLALGALQVVQPRRLRDARVPAEAVVPRLQRLQGAHTCGAWSEQ